MLTRHCVCRLQVLYSAVMVPWSIAFTLHESCDAPGARHDGCIPASLKARARRRSVAQRVMPSAAGCRHARVRACAGELSRHTTLRRARAAQALDIAVDVCFRIDLALCFRTGTRPHTPARA
jgi:hypothetical protein